MSPGKKPDLSRLLLTQTSRVEYKDLCRLDVLSLKDPAVGDQEQVYIEFKDNFSGAQRDGSRRVFLGKEITHPSQVMKEKEN